MLAERLAKAQRKARARLEARRARDVATFHDFLRVAVGVSKHAAVAKCFAAASCNESACNVDLVPLVQKQTFGARFTWDGAAICAAARELASPGDFVDEDYHHEDPELRGWYFSSSPAAAVALKVPREVSLDLVRLMDMVAPRVALALRRQGLHVQVVERCVGRRDEVEVHAKKELNISWRTPAPKVAVVPQTVAAPAADVVQRPCAICTDPGPMEALTPCGHVFCSTCVLEAALRSAHVQRCPICRTVITGSLRIFIP